MNYNDVKKIIYKVLSKETELAESEINEETSFEELGIESVMMLSITRKLEEYFGELPKTLFFEYDNLKQLIHYLCESKNITELKDVSDTTYGKSKPENSYDNNDSRMLSQPIVEGSYSKTENPRKLVLLMDLLSRSQHIQKCILTEKKTRQLILQKTI